VEPYLNFSFRTFYFLINHGATLPFLSLILLPVLKIIFFSNIICYNICSYSLSKAFSQSINAVNLNTVINLRVLLKVWNSLYKVSDW
jgi:hypothetical protein